MNILFLALDININNKTGDSIHVRELATSLAKLGHNITLITATPLFQKIESLQTQENLLLYFREDRGNLSTFSFCGKVIKRHNPDIIYERRFSAKIGATLSKIHRIPLIIEVNGLVEEEAKIVGTAIKQFILVKKFKKWMRKRFFKRASRIVTVSNGIKKGLHEQYGIPIGKMVVIPNGANTELFKPMDKDICKRELNLDTNNKYVCFTGNLVPWQGVEYLIKAAPNVLKEEPSARFIIVGDGMMRNELENIAKELDIIDKVIFTGGVLYELVPKYINASEIGISIKPPLLPGSPLKVKEYMACGKPVIATRNSEYDFEIIEKADAGVLVKPGDKEEVANAILRLLSNSNLSKEMGLRGRNLVVEKYSWMSTAKKVIENCKKSL